MKKMAKFFFYVLILCMLFTTTVLAKEPIINMTYDEWLEEQENISSDSVESDLEPVKVPSNESNEIQAQSMENVVNTENFEMKPLSVVLERKEKIELSEEILTDKTAEELTDSISVDLGVARIAPIAELIPVILNEESLIDGKITTDTRIGFIYNDSDGDSDTIVNRYVGGSASDYIWAEIEEGFIIQITVPGTYELYYQVEDSAGEVSETIGFSIEVVSASPTEEPEKYQVFEGSFTSSEDTATYYFSIDFSQMDSAAVCLVRKGYVGTSIKVYDEVGNEVLYRGTGVRQAKNWGYLEKPSENAGVCKYIVLAEPNNYENKASDYRIIIGDKKETELMMSGIENTVLLDQFYQAKFNLQNNYYVPNVGEYWYKYRRNSTSVITIVSDSSTVRFKVLDADTLNVAYDSARDAETHSTKFMSESGWNNVEKARLTTEVGKDYYLVVYCTSPDINVPIRTGSMATAVGNPFMRAGIVRISPGISVTATKSGYSSARTFTVDGNHIPNTGQVESVSLYGARMSEISRWRLSAPENTLWFTNSANHYPAVDLKYVEDSTRNAKLKGNWSMAFQASSSNYSFIPSFSFIYYHEYGD